MANMSSSVLLTVDPGVHQRLIQCHLEESIHRSQGGRHCAVQERANLQARSLCCQDHPTSPEDKRGHLRSSNSIQTRSWRKIDVCQQTSPPSLPLHGCRVHCSPGGHHKSPGRRRSRNYSSRSQRSSSGNSGQVLQHRAVKLHNSCSTAAEFQKNAQKFSNFQNFQKFLQI